MNLSYSDVAAFTIVAILLAIALILRITKSDGWLTTIDAVPPEAPKKAELKESDTRFSSFEEAYEFLNSIRNEDDPKLIAAAFYTCLSHASHVDHLDWLDWVVAEQPELHLDYAKRNLELMTTLHEIEQALYTWTCKTEEGRLALVRGAELVQQGAPYGHGHQGQGTGVG